MRAYRVLSAVLLLAVFPLAQALWPWSKDTTSWDEEVLLRDGRVLVVHRSVTYGPENFPPSGVGPLLGQSISFSLGGQRIEWISNEKWPIAYTPDILDIVDGDPVIVMPVYRFGPCKKYAFPQEGMIAFAFRRNRWEAVPVTKLPAGLKVNVWGRTAAVRQLDEYKDKKIDLAEKRAYSAHVQADPRLGVPLADAVKYYARVEDSCARIQPLPDPQFDDARRRNASAETNARTLVASITDTSEGPRSVSKADYQSANGVYKGDSRVSTKCNGIVKSVEPIRVFDGRGDWNLRGYQVITSGGTKIPIEQPNLKNLQVPAQLEQIMCDGTRIYVIRRANKGTLMVHRFGHSGELVDAHRITLADIEKAVPGNQWGDLWGVEIADGQFSFAIAKYTYAKTQIDGGTISEIRNYAVKLP